MTQKEELAISGFREGLNCSQAVLTAFSEELKFDKNLAMMVSTGFGGGMGRLQETCGAVTGAFMVLSIYSGNKFLTNNERKENSYSMIQDFNGKFLSKNKTTNCKALLNCDLKTPDGKLYAKENNLFETVCEKCVLDSIKIIDEMIK
jgi:C_GCAxxG_C_C family probable redox protein